MTNQINEGRKWNAENELFAVLVVGVAWDCAFADDHDVTDGLDEVVRHDHSFSGLPAGAEDLFEDAVFCRADLPRRQFAHSELCALDFAKVISVLDEDFHILYFRHALESNHK